MNSNIALENRRARLKRMLAPQSAVFIGGASLIPAIENCRARGFQGRIYVVNPRRSDLAGISCVPDIASLPDVPEVAFIAVPKENVVGVVGELSAIGVAGAICNSAGFSEMRGGEQSQRDLVAAAGEMPIIGPNCPGVANFADRSVFMMDHFGEHDQNGSVALISNGGSYLSDLGSSDRSLPVAYSVGLGNQAMITAADVLDVVLDDERIRAVNIYFESIRNSAALSAAALRAARKGIPVIAIKGGRTTAGQRATQSHTASLAGDDTVASALFRRLGFVQVGTHTEALETLKMLVHAPKVKGRRTAYATSSGTYAVLGSDIAEANGLDLQPPSAGAAKEIEKHLPPYVHAANPLDIVSSAEDEKRTLDIYRAFLSDDLDVAVNIMCYPPEGGWDPTTWDINTTVFAQAARERGLPAAFVNTMPEMLSRSVRERMIANGLAPLQGLEDGLRAVSNAIRSSELAEIVARKSDEEILLPLNSVNVTSSIALDEASAKAELANVGIPVPRSVVVKTSQSTSLEGLVFPVVVKALSADLSHKSELGAVVLRLGTPEEAWQAVRSIAARLKESAEKIAVSDYLVEEMVKDGVGELLVGIRRIDGIGLALTIGMGGTEAELLRDTATVLLPASRATIAETLRGLRLFQLIDGWRGRTKGDVEAAVDTIQKFAQFAISNGDCFVEAEINPLIVRPLGQGAVAVDAVMRLAR
ncbi:acetate--CoA ligase family protein [Allomesorhizobium camelthorni]|uniref:Acetate--CoA ligase family protein n=1 Tax=Allomesorhizobium camelthorni TaxID=475069 RepID=A0A6G4WIU6_9HYPH|nr:acetate--CoA ligase family protein [Mesorhizobium camelthorni]NGO54681.1 acetate--CoA ligase family protein [Mesorhizobium camelthorni]